VDLEAVLLWRLTIRCVVHCANRSMNSRARSIGDAPVDFGAQVVMGSPATLVSGNRTVRVITVSNTRSPNRSTTRAITSRALTVRGFVACQQDAADFQLRVEPVAHLVDGVGEQPRPRNEKYSHSVGMTTPSAQANP